jgi:SpoVK/Ycf46/Vps4 family AAA+-type ATPase
MEKSMPDLQALTTKQQHEERSKLLDRIDGGQTKGKEVMWILTTNYPKMWISAMARPGRTDTYLVFEPLDRPGFEALLRKKIGPWLADDVDFGELWELIGDMSSSFLSGFIKKATKYLLGKQEGYRLGNVELASAARSLRRQWEWYDELHTSEESAQQPTLQQAADSLFSPIIQRELANIVH